jgi:hypothetical protein
MKVVTSRAASADASRCSQGAAFAASICRIFSAPSGPGTLA